MKKMRNYYNQKIFDEFCKKTEGIIKSIENHCDCINDSVSVMVILNKIFYNAEQFFVENQILFKGDSEKFDIIKKQSEMFFQKLKNFQKKYEKGDKSVIFEIKDFLKSWIKNPYIKTSVTQ